MLCKTKITESTQLYTSSSQSSSSTSYAIYTGTLAKAWYLNIKFDKFVKSGSGNDDAFLRLYVGNDYIGSWSSYTTAVNNVNWTSSNMYPAGSSVSIKLEHNSGSITGTVTNITLNLYGYQMKKNVINGKPKGVSNIWALGIIFIYGKDGDTYYGGIVTGDTTTVVTGNIALGNAVGFLEVNYNGTKVKVPYYN